MKRPRLRRLLYPSYAMGMLAVLAAAWLLSAVAVERSAVNEARQALLALAQRAEQSIGPALSPHDERLHKVCASLIQREDDRLAVLLAGGEVACDTGSPPIQISDPHNVVELNDALAGRVGFATRYDYPVERRLAHLTLPVTRGGRTVGVVRASRSLEGADRIKSAIGVNIVGLGAVAGLAALGFAALGARRVGAGVETLRRGVQRYARGELQYRIRVPDCQELAALAESLNGVSTQLHDLVRGMTRDVGRLNAVLASMAEGVIAIDKEQRILSLNHASCQLLGVDEEHAKGHGLHEVVRSTELRRFIEQALACNEPLVSDVEAHGEQRAVLQVRGRALRDADGHTIGAVIVLNDVSALRRLESVRRDFVANVSHELKTPIASIKGFAETLLDGAMHQPEDQQRFLEIIAKQADRLNAIIEDLLSLSRIEQGEDAATIAFERGSIRAILQTVVEERRETAAERDVSVELTCDDSITAEINSPLLEEAVANLIDNAIKYSEPGGDVRVVGAAANGEVTISVIDRGCGIAAEHIPRIFERFYRVDKARSRKLGGTGLGLAIVKHIVQAHRGRVTVDTTPGSGSTFTVHLPRK